MRLPTVRLYRHIRHAYQALVNRRYARRRRELAMFLSEFIAPGDLVFDVGANVGNYTDVLLALRARVVAIEPNPALAGTIRRHYPVWVEQAAVGSEPGALDLHLAVDPGHSTVSWRWLERAPLGHVWSGEVISVPVVTLDDLIERYGSAAFVKIDVEGFEADVLRGCSTPPPALSFEYQCPDLEVALECIDLLDGYEFNTVLLTRTRFDGPWASAADVTKRLQDRCAADPETYGDVYARKLGWGSPRAISQTLRTVKLREDGNTRY